MSSVWLRNEYKTIESWANENRAELLALYSVVKQRGIKYGLEVIPLEDFILFCFYRRLKPCLTP